MSNVSRRSGRHDATERIRELVALLGSLSRRGDSISLEAISQRLGISVQEASDLMSIMITAAGEESGGLLISANEDESEFTLQYGTTKGRPVRLTNAETIAVLHALDLCGLEEDDALRLRVQETLATGDMRADQIRRALGAGTADKSLITCIWAQVEERTLLFDYRGLRDDTPRSRQVLVRQVRRHKGTWHIDAFDLECVEERTFRMDRMHNARLGEVRRLPLIQETTTPTIGIYFSSRLYFEAFDWPGLVVLSEVDGIIRGTIPFFGPHSDWMIRRIAACEGTVTVEDERIMADAQKYARMELERASSVGQGTL